MANFIPNSVGVLQGTFGSAVANSGTVTLSYPTGFTQASFTAGLLGPNSTLILNGSNKLAIGGSAFSLTFNSSDITLTNLSGASWAAGTTYILGIDQQDGNDIVVYQFPFALADIANGDIVTDFRPGVDGTIEDIEFLTTKAVTTAAKAATLNVEIETTDLTGGLISLTSAAATPIGKVIAGTAITGNNTITKASKISIEASSVTAFVEGTGLITMRVRKTPSLS